MEIGIHLTTPCEPQRGGAMVAAPEATAENSSFSEDSVTLHYEKNAPAKAPMPEKSDPVTKNEKQAPASSPGAAKPAESPAEKEGFMVNDRKGIITAFDYASFHENSIGKDLEDHPRSASALLAAGDAPPQKLNAEWGEFKILLDGTQFSDPEKAVKSLWKTVKKVAKEEEIKLKEKDDAFTPRTRYIRYIDTSSQVLSRSGYVLRERRDKGEEEGNCELVLKFRSASLEEAASKDVAPSPEYGDAPSLEVDVGSNLEGIKELYSHSGKAVINKSVGSTLGDYASVFPGLGKIEAPPGSPLRTVNDLTIEEHNYTLAKVVFPEGDEGKASLSIWYRNEEKGAATPLIAEFSFTSPQERSSDDRFMKALRNAIKSWIADVPYHTKTEYVYHKAR